MSFRKSSFKQDPMTATGSYTGTFVGDGSDLTDVPGGSPTGTFTGSFTGAFSGDGTSITSIQTASFAETASLLLGSVESASFATSASHAVTASFALAGGDGGSTILTPPTASISGTFVTESIRAWYKADVGITTAVSGVARWEDQSGHGNHLTQSQIADGAAEPSFIDLSGSAFPSLPAVRFNGVDEYLIVTLSADLTGSGLTPHAPGVTVGMTMRHLNKTVNFGGVICFGRTDTTQDFNSPNTFVIAIADNVTNWRLDRNSVGHVFKKYRNRAPQAVVSMIDGDDVDIWQGMRLDTFTDSESAISVQAIILGGRKSNTTFPIVNFGNVEFAEIIVYDVGLNPDEVNALLDYLHARAGLD